MGGVRSKRRGGTGGMPCGSRRGQVLPPGQNVSAGPVALCRLDELADPGSREFKWGAGIWPLELFAVRKGGRVTGFVNRCPHAGNPLNWRPDRFLNREGDLILCNSHGALFRTDDGVCVGGPCPGEALEAVPLRVEDGRVVADEAELAEVLERSLSGV